MSVSVKADVSSPLAEGRNIALGRTISKCSTDSLENKNDDIVSGQECNVEQSEPSTPKPFPMAFTIDFGSGKQVDNRKLEELAKKSQARHQRVHSMSASVTRPSPAALKPPMSVKLPRKTQGYNSEGYFSSDQEDSGLSSSVKFINSKGAQNADKMITVNSAINRHVKSPPSESSQVRRASKSPIVDGIMSRSDNFITRQGLNLPLKSTTSPYPRDVHRTPSYNNLSSNLQTKHFMAEIMNQSPEMVLLTDISSPELDILTPDNGTSTPEKSPVMHKAFRGTEPPDLLFRQCTSNAEPLYIDDDIDTHSNSSTGTYTIEGNNYTEEQKARMSIDRTFGADILNETLENKPNKHVGSNEKDPELIFDFTECNRVITSEPQRGHDLRSMSPSNTTFDISTKVSKDKNVLEISCCYESPSENDLATQTSKQIKSTRSYLEKIKNRVRTITDKTFPKSPPRAKNEGDVGSFTSVTTSGVLSSKCPLKVVMQQRRRCSLTKSDIDQTDYVHRLSRESSVPVSLPSNKTLPFEDTKFESSVLKNAQRAIRDDRGVSPGVASDQVVGKLSHLSLNRCKGDKTWIQDWADSVKKYNNNTLTSTDSDSTFIIEDQDRPSPSPRHILVKPRSPHGGTPSKIPSPVGTLLHRKTPDLIPTQDTEAYLLKTQNAISNLQAKLHSSRTSNLSNIPSQLTSSLISEKTATSRLPVAQLSRSNSLNYRLRSKESSGGNSPLRSPGHYVITGSTKPDGKTLVNTASRSFDAEENKDRDSNMNSPCSDRQLSNSSDDKTLSNRPRYDVEAILSPHRRTHARHKSFDGRNATEYFSDTKNANQNVVSLKSVLKNNALEAYPRIDQSRCQGDATKIHQRVLSDGTKPFRNVYVGNDIGFGSLKRSSSFNTVNKNNNYIEPRFNSRRSSGNEEYNLSDESDGSYDKSQELRFKRPIHRGRIDSPDLKFVPANSPKCPNTPELHRKFGSGLVRSSVRVTSKERRLNRFSEPPASREEKKPIIHQSRSVKISEPTRQVVLNRLTKSRSSTREFQPKNHDKGQKKPTQHRSSSALATKEVEFSNWKKRSSYDPMKAAREGKKRQQMAKQQEFNKDDLSSPSHSSPVHRSQSFHTTNMGDLTLDYSSEGTEDDQLVTLPVDPMVTSTHSDILDLRKVRELRKQAINNDVVISRDYVTFQINQPLDKSKRRSDTDKRKTYIIDDITPTKENVDFLSRARDADSGTGGALDKRKTFILDSDTNSTTNGSSPRNSSIFSHEKNSMTTCTSDTEGESGTESAPVPLTHQGGSGGRATNKQRHSGEFSMSSSTTSINQQKKREVQPRYMDISKYKNETAPKNFLRRDPSKTYVGVLAAGERGAGAVTRCSVQQQEMEQKKQELEKWKRRASYDPRKSAAQGRGGSAAPVPRASPRTASSVLRSQSFHGPVLASATSARCSLDRDQRIAETYDASSDNDF